MALPALDNLAADLGVTLPFATASLPPTSSCRTRGATLGGSDRTVAVLDEVGRVAGVVDVATRGVSGERAVFGAATPGFSGRLLLVLDERSADIADPCYEDHIRCRPWLESVLGDNDLLRVILLSDGSVGSFRALPRRYRAMIRMR